MEEADNNGKGIRANEKIGMAAPNLPRNGLHIALMKGYFKNRHSAKALQVVARQIGTYV